MRKSSLLLGASALSAPGIVHMSAYANTLTRLIPELYAALDVVSRELVGFIPSVSRNTSAERAAVGQAVVWPVSPSANMFNVTPAMTVPEPADATIGNGSITITKSRGAEFGMTGEEQLGLSHGVGALTIQGDMFAQGLRALVNEIETDLAVTAAVNASRAWGTAGTTPFAPGVNGNLADSAQVRKILDDNGAPASDRSCVIDTSAGANLRTQYNLTRVNEAGTMMTLRDGELLNLHGMSFKESAKVQTDAPGGGADYTTNTAGYAVGATAITIITGTGTIQKGDIVTFAGDANKYVVAADRVGAGVLTLAAPGLRQAIPASATNITVVAASVRNVAFPRTALALAARAPALPDGGDSAVDRFMLTDPRSGMAFEVSVYAVYRKMRAEVTCAWGTAAVKPEHIALLLG